MHAGLAMPSARLTRAARVGTKSERGLAAAHVAEVVGDDQVVQALGVDRAVGQRVARGQGRDVGGDEVVVRVAALADPGDLPEPRR